LNLSFFKRLDDFVGRSGVSDNDIDIRSGTNPPTGDYAELAAIHYGNLSPGVLDHRGIELRLIRYKATHAVFRINSVRTHEEC
jgi:hypothetical protein